MPRKEKHNNPDPKAEEQRLAHRFAALGTGEPAFVPTQIPSVPLEMHDAVRGLVAAAAVLKAHATVPEPLDLSGPAEVVSAWQRAFGVPEEPLVVRRPLDLSAVDWAKVVDMLHHVLLATPALTHAIRKDLPRATQKQALAVGIAKLIEEQFTALAAGRSDALRKA